MRLLSAVVCFLASVSSSGGQMHAQLAPVIDLARPRSLPEELVCFVGRMFWLIEVPPN